MKNLLSNNYVRIAIVAIAIITGYMIYKKWQEKNALADAIAKMNQDPLTDRVINIKNNTTEEGLVNDRTANDLAIAIMDIE